jgi:deoxyribodipyrimidine photolyase
MKEATWWIRNDLRLHSNTTLTRAIGKASTILPVYVLKPESKSNAHQYRRLLAALLELATELRRRRI